MYVLETLFGALISLHGRVSPLLIHASRYSIFLSRELNLSLSKARRLRQLKSNEFKKSQILLILPVITSIYSLFAQSCWICFWKSSGTMAIDEGFEEGVPDDLLLPGCGIIIWGWGCGWWCGFCWWWWLLWCAIISTFPSLFQF